MTAAADAFAGGAPSLKELQSAAETRRRLLLLVLTGLLAASAGLSLCVGAMPVSVADILHAIFPFGEAADAQAAGIVSAIRLPRLLLGICVGATLGICGAAMQGLFRNPLADPGIVGISGGAAMAAALVIVLGNWLAPELVTRAGVYALPLAAFAGSSAAILTVYRVSRTGEGVNGASLILAGIAITAIAGAGLGYLSFVSTDAQLRELTFWTLGSLGRISWASLVPAALLMLAASFAVLNMSRDLNVWLLGEREAEHLGVDTERLKRLIVICVALGVGAAVAVTGIIGFVGLAAPHIVRLIAGSDHRVVLPGSALLGALLLVTGDMIARTAVAPAELPIGVLTNALGGPFFLWLLSRHRRELH